MDYWGKYTEKLTIFKVPLDAKPVLLARTRDVPPRPGFSRDPGSHNGWVLCLSTTAMETRSSAMWAVQPGQEDLRKLWPPALGAPRDLGAPGLGLPALSRAPARSRAWPGPPFPPVAQSRAPGYHLLLRNIRRTSAGSMWTLVLARSTPEPWWWPLQRFSI